MYRLYMAIIATCLAIALFWAVNRPSKKVDCTDYGSSDIVEVVTGPYQGAEGIVFASRFTRNSGCEYKVRGQRGIEMPFTEWFNAYELDRADVN